MSSASIAVSDLDVERVGSGPTVVLVHGSIVGARQTWRKQRSLGASWTLVMPNRPGFGDSPPLERGDFEVEAELIAELLGDGAGGRGRARGRRRTSLATPTGRSSRCSPPLRARRASGR